MESRRSPSDRTAPRVAARVFRSELGWMGLVTHGQSVQRLLFGQRRRLDAERAVGELFDPVDADDAWSAQLVRRLEAFSQGEHDLFEDVEIATEHLTPFARRVVAACRRIAYGQTQSYAELARLARRPGAARAVGNVMARNRVPLIVPCHRVIGSGGKLGGYSAPDGLGMKRRLLQMESAPLLV